VSDISLMAGFLEENRKIIEQYVDMFAGVN
jgi:hypothetical protein